MVKQFFEKHIAERAAALSYYFLFALFPSLLFLTALLGILPGPRLMSEFLDYVGRVMPDDAASLVGKTLKEVVSGAGSGLLSVGAVGALWAASNGMGSLMSALDEVFGLTEHRAWWKRKLVAIGLTLGFCLFIVCSLALLAFGGRLGLLAADRFGLGDAFLVVWNFLRWLIVGGSGLAAIALVYRLAPAKRRHRWVTPGSAFAFAGWIAMSLGLRFWVQQFGNYNKVYGSIGGVVLLLLWFYLSSLILLLGAELDAEIDAPP